MAEKSSTSDQSPTTVEDARNSGSGSLDVNDKEANDAAGEVSERGLSNVEVPKEEPPKPAGPPLPPPPIDHGLKCWLQVVASFAMWTNTWGIVNSFGVFQT